MHPFAAQDVIYELPDADGGQTAPHRPGPMSTAARPLSYRSFASALVSVARCAAMQSEMVGLGVSQYHLYEFLRRC